MYMYTQNNMIQAHLHEQGEESNSQTVKSQINTGDSDWFNSSLFTNTAELQWLEHS